MNREQYLEQLKILYVEDQDLTREGIKNFLKRRAGKVFTASNGREGLEIYLDEKPDIVIADLLMPEMTGMEMLSEIRKNNSDCKFIITSTVGEPGTMMEAIDVGVVKYVVKPVELTIFEETLLKVADELRRDAKESPDSNPERKRKLEAAIKKEITLFIKDHAGKGPRDVSVFIHDNFVDVVAYDTLTVFEQSLMKNKTNHSLVEYGRCSFYTTAKNELECLVGKITEKKVEMEKTEISPGRSDKIVFTYK